MDKNRTFKTRVIDSDSEPITVNIHRGEIVNIEINRHRSRILLLLPSHADVSAKHHLLSPPPPQCIATKGGKLRAINSNVIIRSSTRNYKDPIRKSELRKDSNVQGFVFFVLKACFSFRFC